MIAINAAYEAIKEFFWGRSFKLQATLNLHYIETRFSSAMKIYETEIYSMDPARSYFYDRKIRYISLDEDGARRWHHIAIKLVSKIESGELAPL